MNQVQKDIVESIELKKRVLEALPSKIQSIGEQLQSVLHNGNKILIAGNGGSAADSQHFAAELVGRYKKERKALAAIALSTDTSIITAWSNDYSFDTIYERQIEALGKKGDVFFALSTSGNSNNLIKAALKCKQMEIKTIGLLGKEGGKLNGILDQSIIIPSSNTPRIQECHIMIIHILCEIIEG